MPSCKQHKISVILPCLSQEGDVDQSVQSVGNQSFCDFELLVVGSKYPNADKRVSIIDCDNSHFGHLYNVGIDAAKGDFIAFLEPGNIMHPSMLETLYDSAAHMKVDFIKADFRVNGRNARISAAGEYGVIQGGLFSTGVINPFVRSGLYNREFLDENNIRFDESRLLSGRQIYTFDLQVQKFAKAGYLLPQCVMEYEYTPRGMSESALVDLISELQFLLNRFDHSTQDFINYYTVIWNLFCDYVLRLLRKLETVSESILELCDQFREMFTVKLRKHSINQIGQTSLADDNRYVLFSTEIQSFFSYMKEHTYA